MDTLNKRHFFQNFLESIIFPETFGMLPERTWQLRYVEILI